MDRCIPFFTIIDQHCKGTLIAGRFLSICRTNVFVVTVSQQGATCGQSKHVNMEPCIFYELFSSYSTQFAAILLSRFRISIIILHVQNLKRSCSSVWQNLTLSCLFYTEMLWSAFKYSLFLSCSFRHICTNLTT